MHPKVSVIIPTYNRESYLYLAIKSVLDQTFEDFEIIVVDDASTGSIREVINNFNDDRIRYIRHKQNKGGSAARNTGIVRSKGEFIAFLDDDDLWIPEKLEKQLELINRKPEISIVYSGVKVINKSGRIIGSRIPFARVRGNILPYILKKNYIGGCSMVLLRKECFNRVGLFDENLPASQDYDMWIRLAKQFQFDYVGEPLVLYRVHQKRITANPCLKLRAQELIFKKFSTHLNARINRREILGYWHYGIGKSYCQCGDMWRGRKEFVKAITKDPCSLLYFVRLFASFFGLTAHNALDRIIRSKLLASSVYVHYYYL